MKLSENSYSIIYLTEQLKAVQALLHDTPDFFYRKVCRWYSKEYHTPLIQVYDLPYHHVLQNYYEAQFDKRSYNDVFDYTTKELLKLFIDKEEEANKAFAEELLKEQQATIARKKAKEEKEAQAKAAMQQDKEKDFKVPEFDMKFDGKEDKDE